MVKNTGKSNFLVNLKGITEVFLVISFLFGLTITTPEEDYNAICAIIHSIQGTSWGGPCPNPNPYCNVTCINPYCNMSIPSLVCSHQLVTQIDFYTTNSLNGTIPSQIGLLTALQKLDFSQNQLSGTIPTQIGQLTSLTNLVFYQNQLSGTIPTQIGQLNSLTTLVISYEKINGTIPTQIGYLTALERIIINNTGVVGTIPTQITKLIQISYISLGNTLVSGSIPSQLGSLPLITLDLDNTSLCGCLNSTKILECSINGVTILYNCSLSKNCITTVNRTSDCLDCQFISWSNWSVCENGVQNRTKMNTMDGTCPVGTQNCSSDIDSSSPIPEMTPLPRPIAGIIPIPVPFTPNPTGLEKDCQNDYYSLFVCSNGMWFSTKDVILSNGTSLANTTFDLSGITIIENVFIISSSVIINKNLVLGSNSILTLENTKLVVKGDLQILSGVTLILDFTSTINISGCAFLDGKLVISFSLEQSSPIIVITAHCINGTFSNVEIIPLDGNSCNKAIYQKTTYLESVSVFFSVQDKCGEIPFWIWIIVGVVVLFAVMVVVIGVIIIRRKKKRELKKLRRKLEMGKSTL